MYKLISLTPIINIFKVKDTYKDKDQAGSISMLLITSTPIVPSPPSPWVGVVRVYGDISIRQFLTSHVMDTVVNWTHLKIVFAIFLSSSIVLSQDFAGDSEANPWAHGTSWEDGCAGNLLFMWIHHDITNIGKLLQIHIQFMQPYQVIDLDSPGGSGAEAELMSAELRQKYV